MSSGYIQFLSFTKLWEVDISKLLGQPRNRGLETELAQGHPPRKWQDWDGSPGPAELRQTLYWPPTMRWGKTGEATGSWDSVVWIRTCLWQDSCQHHATFRMFHVTKDASWVSSSYLRWADTPRIECWRDQGMSGTTWGRKWGLNEPNGVQTYESLLGAVAVFFGIVYF